MPSQWETSLLCNDISQWLGASLESALYHTLNSQKITKTSLSNPSNIESFPHLLWPSDTLWWYRSGSKLVVFIGTQLETFHLSEFSIFYHSTFIKCKQIRFTKWNSLSHQKTKQPCNNLLPIPYLALWPLRDLEPILPVYFSLLLWTVILSTSFEIGF